ncbi:MAG: hypothetical protein ACPL4C_03920 [Brevinematia bacterium]
MEEKVRKFISLIRMYNDEPNKRVFKVDRDCYVVFTGFSPLDERPFIRVGYSTYIEKIKKHISNVVVSAGYLSSLKDEIKQIETDEFDTNFIVPSSVYNVILKFLKKEFHHKVNVKVIDKSGEEKELNKVLSEISEKYKSYVLLYDNANFAITFSGKKIFDMFSTINNDLTTSKIVYLFSLKFYDLLPNNSILRISGSYVIKTKNGEIFVITDQFDERSFLKNFVPLAKVREVIGNDVISLIDGIRLIFDRSSLKVFTNRSVFEDFKQFNVGIKFVDVSDRINIINNVNIVLEEGKYYIPLKDRDGRDKNLLLGDGEVKNKLELYDKEYVVLENFNKQKFTGFYSDIIFMDPVEGDFDKEFLNIRENMRKITDKRIFVSDIEKEFEKDNRRVANDRKRLEELIDAYEFVYSLAYTDKINLLVRSERLEGTEKGEEIQEIAKRKVSEGDFVSEVSSVEEKHKVVTEEKRKKISSERRSYTDGFFRFRYWWVLGVLVLLLLVGGVGLLFRESIYNFFGISLTQEERRVSQIISNLDNIYEPELTEVQKTLGITITDYDIWVYVNKVAVINGYKPLTYRKPKKWEDPDWVYPGNKLKLLDGSYVVIRQGDNMWNISKRKIIEDYIKKNFTVTVKSKAGTNVYEVRKKSLK